MLLSKYVNPLGNTGKSFHNGTSPNQRPLTKIALMRKLKALGLFTWVVSVQPCTFGKKKKLEKKGVKESVSSPSEYN